MSYFYKILFIFPLIFFTACASKNKINIKEEINSISLYKNVVVLSAPNTVPSPLSFGLGVGQSLSKHVGISMGTVIRPEVSNDEALDLEKSMALYDISLSNLVKMQFSEQMENDDYYSDKFVPFGANYTIHLFVTKYIIDTSIFSSNANIKIFIDLEILNKNSDVIYRDSVVSNSLTYKESSLLNNKAILEKALKESVFISIDNLITNMKRD